jgi:NADH-quinone oxidoreductase subunit K
MKLSIEILSLTTFLFFTGTIGVALNRKNIIITMMSIELMLLAVNLNFLIFSQQFDDIVGQIFVLFILTIAASESAIGLSILTLYHNIKNTITFDVVKNQNFNLFSKTN